MKTLLFTSGLYIILFSTAAAQRVLPLYAGSIPNAIAGADAERGGPDGVVHVSKPTLTVFLPAGGTKKAAVIICPGGGYGELELDREGYRVAKAFVQMGLAAFVLKYRLPDTAIMKDQSTGPLQDAQQAIKTVRQQATAFGVDETKIGLVGFSAGGHLAATAATHYTPALVENKTGISLRPDFLILVYPVISFQEGLVHAGSMRNLLGNAPTAAQRAYFSTEAQVTAATPPAFLVHASDDVWVPPGNSIAFYEALQRAGVPAELHLYAKGSHGFLNYPPQAEWLGRCRAWLRLLQFIPN